MPTFFINSDSFKASNAFVATLGAAPGSTYLGQIIAAGLPTAANAMLAAMAATTVQTRADAIAANLGLTGTAASSASNYLQTVAFAGAASTHGQGLLTALDLFTTLQNDATFGTAATAYVARVNTALSYSSVAANNSTDLTTLAAAVGSAGSSGAGSTFTLTTGIDNVTTASTINALIDQNTAANTTWNLSDTVAPTVSGGGTVNLSQITAAATLAGYNTSGVTTLKVKPIDAVNTATAAGFDVGSMTGLTKVTVNNASVIGTTADTFTVNSIPGTASVDLVSNGSTQNVAVNYASAATAGTADTITVGVTGRSGTLTIGTGFETLAVTGGAAGRLAGANSDTTATIKTVTVGGTDLRIDAALDTTVTSIDASKATGTVNLAAAPGSTFSAKGGAGTSDVLALSTLSASHTVSGFEQITATAAATYDLTGVTDATKLGVNVGAGAVTFSNAAATQNNIVIGGAEQRTTAPAATGSLTTGGGVTWGLKTATGTADVLNIAVSNGGTASTGTMTVGGAITTSAIETVNLATSDWKAVTVGGNISFTTTTTANGTFKATGASNLSLTTNAIVFNGGLATGTDTVDLSGLTGTFTGGLTMGSGNLTFTGGSGVTTLTTSAPVASKTQDITTGAAADVVTITSMATTAGTTKVNTGAGDDRITLDATADQVTANQLISIDGGAGTGDLLATVGTGNSKTINATIAGIEVIQFESTLATALNLTVASGYADTVRIVDAAGNSTVTFNTTSGGTVNLSKITTVGWTSGTDILGVNSNTGNESFTFGATTSSGGAIAETYQALGASTNGSDTIASFTVGNGGDIINIKQADTTGTATSAGTANVWTKASTAVNAANEIIVLNAATYATAALAEAAMTTYAGATITATDDVIFVYSNGTDAFVYKDVNAGTTTAGGADLTLLVTLTGITSVNTMTVQNFGLTS